MAYRYVDHAQLASELCRATGKYGLYLSFPTDNWDELEKAAPYLWHDMRTRDQQDGDNPMQCGADGTAVILCDTEAEQRVLYNQTVGDDGPTESNPYDGPCRVYALTIGPDGEFLTENT